MKERFEGANRPHLISALQRQEITCGIPEIAERLAAIGVLLEFCPGEKVITQGGHDNDIFF